MRVDRQFSSPRVRPNDALLCQTDLAPGLNAGNSECSFPSSLTMAVHAVGSRFAKTPLRDDGFDLAAIRAAINEDTRIVFRRILQSDRNHG